MSAFFSVSRRVSAMISAIASSTTLRVLENGALKTATPRAPAAARSIWLVPMQNAPIGQQVGRLGEHGRGDVGLGADAEQLDAGQRLDQLGLVERAARPAGPRQPAGAQQVDGVRVDSSPAAGLAHCILSASAAMADAGAGDRAGGQPLRADRLAGRFHR